MIPGIKPCEGMVAVRPLEEKNSGKMSSGYNTPGPTQEPEAVAELAFVIAAGAKTQVKEGQTVFVRPGYLSWGTKIDDTTIVIDQYAIVAIVTD